MFRQSFPLSTLDQDECLNENGLGLAPGLDDDSDKSSKDVNHG